MTDSEFMLRALRHGRATTMELIRASIAYRGCGITPHSRAADLRRQGHKIICERLPNRAGRPTYAYELREDTR